MLTGVADLLLSTLRSGGFDKVREELEHILKEVSGLDVLVEDYWISMLPILEIWGLEKYGVGDIAQLLREGTLRPSTGYIDIARWRGKIVAFPNRVLRSLAVTSPRPILFIRPFSRGGKGEIPIIAIPVESTEYEAIINRIFGKEIPMLTAIPIDFTDLEESLKILETEYPTARELVEEFFKNNQEVFDLLQTVGTAYENVEQNPIIFLVPHQKIATDRQNIDLLTDIALLALYPTFELSIYHSPPRHRLLKASTVVERELVNWLREEKFKIFKQYPQNLLSIYPQTRYLRIEPANTFTEYTTRLAKRTLNTP